MKVPKGDFIHNFVSQFPYGCVPVGSECDDMTDHTDLYSNTMLSVSLAALRSFFFSAISTTCTTRRHRGGGAASRASSTRAPITDPPYMQLRPPYLACHARGRKCDSDKTREGLGNGLLKCATGAIAFEAVCFLWRGRGHGRGLVQVVHATRQQHPCLMHM